MWYANLKYGFWRPETAIALADTDVNPATVSDASWTPLVTTPPYTEYVSGYTAEAGSFTQALARTLHTRHLRLTLRSTAVPEAVRHSTPAPPSERTW